MILIADSGSTKTNWALIREGEAAEIIQTEGINPFFRDNENIRLELKKELLPYVDNQISEVYFYAAGIINKEKGAGLRLLLEGFFPKARVETNSDLLAAARATCKGQKGIACILGTGSNSCLYDGEKITAHVSPLGFILGDEGSGAVMGRKLVGDYLKNIMPERLRLKFLSEYCVTGPEIIEKVYRQERPNLFLSKFTTFLHRNINDDYCRKFIKTEFHLFVARNLLNYEAIEDLSINFVGSVAFHFKEILQEVLEELSLHSGIIIKDPMKGLIHYHST